MNKTVEKGKTLLVDGPASVAIVSGNVEVFGFSVKNVGKIVIREGKRMPFTALGTSTFEMLLGKSASIQEVDGNTIPPSWVDSLDALDAFQEKPVTVMVLGKTDSGKTSFCTYLINRLITGKQKVAVLDGDLGQSDIGPPCAVAYAFVTKPVTDLFALKTENAFFMGFTSPSEAVGKTIQGIKLMKQEILSKTVDFIVVNTGGWVEGEEAIAYKAQLAEELKPNVVFCIRQNGELIPLLVALEEFRRKVVESPTAVRERSMEKRRNLRELGYIKYLADAKVKTWSIKLLAIEEQDKVKIMQDGEGLLLGLYDAQRKFLGIGVLRKVDYGRKALKVLTSVSEKPTSISLGKVRLDENLKEVVAIP